MRLQIFSQILNLILLSFGFLHSNLLLADDPIAEALMFGKGPAGNSEQKQAYDFLVGNPPFKSPPRVGIWKKPNLTEVEYIDNLDDDSIELLMEFNNQITLYDWEIIRKSSTVKSPQSYISKTFKPAIDVPAEFIHESTVAKLEKKGIIRKFPETFRYTKFFPEIPLTVPARGEFHDVDLPLGNHANYKYLHVEGKGTIVLQAFNPNGCEGTEAAPQVHGEHLRFIHAKRTEKIGDDSTSSAYMLYDDRNYSLPPNEEYPEPEKLYFVAYVFPEAFSLKAIAQEFGAKSIQDYYERILAMWEGVKFLQHFRIYGTAINAYFEYLDCWVDIHHCSIAELFMKREGAESIVYDSLLDTIGWLSLKPKYAKTFKTLWIAGAVGSVGLAAGNAIANNSFLTPTDYARFIVLALVAPSVFKNRTPQKVFEEVDGILNASNNFDPSKIRLGNSASAQQKAAYARMNFVDFTVPSTIKSEDLAKRLITLYPDASLLTKAEIDTLVRSYVTLVTKADQTVKGIFDSFHDPDTLRILVKNFHVAAAASPITLKNTFVTTTSTVSEWKRFILKETGNTQWANEFVGEMTKAESKLAAAINYQKGERGFLNLTESQLVDVGFQNYTQLTNNVSDWFLTKRINGDFPGWLKPASYIRMSGTDVSYVNLFDPSWGDEAYSLLKNFYGFDAAELAVAQKIFARMQSWNSVVNYEEIRHFVQYGDNQRMFGYDLSYNGDFVRFLPLRNESVNYKAWMNSNSSHSTLKFVKDNSSILEKSLKLESHEVHKFLQEIEKFYANSFYSMTLDRHLNHETEIILELLKHADMTNDVHVNIIKGMTKNHHESRPTALIWDYLEKNPPKLP